MILITWHSPKRCVLKRDPVPRRLHELHLVKLAAIVVAITSSRWTLALFGVVVVAVYWLTATNSGMCNTMTQRPPRQLGEPPLCSRFFSLSMMEEDAL